MNVVDQATQTQIKNIQAKTGKSLDELVALVRDSGLTKHGEVRDMLKRELGLGHGDANTLAHVALKSDGASLAEGKGTDELLDAIYAGPKTALRPIHDRLMAAIATFGPFEIAPKKGYVSLRRKKQFAMIGPATNTKVEVGLNVKDLPSADRLVAVPAGGMCNFKVRLGTLDEVDDQMVGWLRQAFDSAG